MDSRARTTLMYLLASAYAAPLAAQATHELRGVVVDTVSGAPVAGAVVRIPTLQRYTITNEDGWFGFARLERGLYVLTVGQLGYGNATPAVRVPMAAPLTVRIGPEPVVLEALQVHNDRLSREARGIAHTMWPNAFYRVFDRDRILATGAADGLAFLREGPRMPIKACRPFEEDSPMCTRVPFAGVSYGRLMGRAVGGTSGVRLPGGAGNPNRIAAIKGMTTVPVFVDDAWFPGGIAGLATIPIADIHRVETFGVRGESQIRVYTGAYLEHLATGARRPALTLPPEHLYEPPDLFFGRDTARSRR